MPRHDLEHGPDEVTDQTNSNRLLAAKPVAEGECEDCPEEGAELLVMLESILVTILSSMEWRNTHRKGARGDARDIGIFGLGEPFLEV